MFDKDDARLLTKVAVVITGASSLLLISAGTVGLAWRVFTTLAGV